MNAMARWGIAATVFVSIVTGIASSALAHCDTLDGPVVSLARQALEKKDVKIGFVPITCATPRVSTTASSATALNSRAQRGFWSTESSAVSCFTRPRSHRLRPSSTACFALRPNGA